MRRSLLDSANNRYKKWLRFSTGSAFASKFAKKRVLLGLAVLFLLHRLITSFSASSGISSSLAPATSATAHFDIKQKTHPLSPLQTLLAPSSLSVESSSSSIEGDAQEQQTHPSPYWHCPFPAVTVPGLTGGYCSPSFFILGTFKSGTTSLYSYLGRHPAISLLTAHPPTQRPPTLASLVSSSSSSFSTFIPTLSSPAPVRNVTLGDVQLKETNFFVRFVPFQAKRQTEQGAQEATPTAEGQGTDKKEETKEEKKEDGQEEKKQTGLTGALVDRFNEFLTPIDRVRREKAALEKEQENGKQTGKDEEEMENTESETEEQEGAAERRRLHRNKKQRVSRLRRGSRWHSNGARKTTGSIAQSGDLKDYLENYFPALLPSAHQLTGEATPSYLFTPNVPENLRLVYPNARLMTLLREPIARSYARVTHLIGIGCTRSQMWASPSPAAGTIGKEGETGANMPLFGGEGQDDMGEGKEADKSSPSLPVHVWSRSHFCGASLATNKRDIFEELVVLMLPPLRQCVYTHFPSFASSAPLPLFGERRLFSSSSTATAKRALRQFVDPNEFVVTQPVVRSDAATTSPPPQPSSSSSSSSPSPSSNPYPSFVSCTHAAAQGIATELTARLDEISVTHRHDPVRLADEIWHTMLLRKAVLTSTLAHSLYAIQLRHWFQTFPASQMLILRSETFYNQTQKQMEQVAEFLQLPRLLRETAASSAVSASGGSSSAVPAGAAAFDWAPIVKNIYNVFVPSVVKPESPSSSSSSASSTSSIPGSEEEHHGKKAMFGGGTSQRRVALQAEVKQVAAATVVTPKKGGFVVQTHETFSSKKQLLSARVTADLQAFFEPFNDHLARCLTPSQPVQFASSSSSSLSSSSSPTSSSSSPTSSAVEPRWRDAPADARHQQTNEEEENKRVRSEVESGAYVLRWTCGGREDQPPSSSNVRGKTQARTYLW